MKLFNTHTVLCFLFGSILLASCDYLDIYPDEGATEEDMSADRNSAYNFMYSCYSYLPMPVSHDYSLDLLTGDEVSTTMTQYNWYYMTSGNYSASNPWVSYWDDLYKGIRQCFIFDSKLEDASQFPGLADNDRQDYRAQVKFLIGYYHFLLARCYGPIILIRETPSATTAPEDYLGRSPYDECVNYICKSFQDAIDMGLPATRSGDRAVEFGLATSVAAKAMIAKMRLYAASDLFNGKKDIFQSIKNPDGTELMSVNDPGKWDTARKAYEEAIALAISTGYALYDKSDANKNKNAYPEDPVIRALRYTATDYTSTDVAVGGNSEVIWADCRTQSDWGIQACSTPFVSGVAYNNIAPTLTMLKRFYTKKGLPIEEDPDFDSDPTTMFEPTIVDEAHKEEADLGAETSKFNLDREPRYYAWIAFQGGFYEIISPSNNGAFNNDPSYRKYSGSAKGKLVCDFMLGGNCSRGTVSAERGADYSLTGFLNKKMVDPDRSQTANGFAKKFYPWPLIRLSELYLGYAEACIECGDAYFATAKTYIDKVRERAGLKGIDASWTKAKHPEKANTQDGLRDIVRQERLVELYLENQNFWDIRRWLLGGKYFNVSSEGLNIEATNIDDFCTVTIITQPRAFDEYQALMPIPVADVNKNAQLVQNPGY